MNMKHYLFKNIKMILLFSIGFFILIIANYWMNLYILKSTIYDLQIQSMNDVSNHLNKWLEAKISSLYLARDFVSKLNPDENEKRIHEILTNSSKLAGFATIAMQTSYSPTLLLDKETSLYQPEAFFYHEKTLFDNTITLHFEPYHDTMSLVMCTPLRTRNAPKRVLCGTLPLTYIQAEIASISLPYDGKAFLIDQNKRILVHHDAHYFFTRFPCELDKNSCHLIKTSECLENYIFSYAPIKLLDGYLIAQLEKEKVYEKVDEQLFINIVIYTVSLLLFILLNLLYNILAYKNVKQLSTAKALIHNFIDHNEKGILIADDTQHITYYNQRFLELLKVSNLESKNNYLSTQHPFYQNLPPWVQSCMNKMIKATIKKQKTWENAFSFSYNNQRFHFFCIMSPVKDSKGNYKGMIIILDDITERTEEKQQKKEQEDILFQQSKMADLGKMIGAISHQWRQPLNAISILLGNLLQFKKMKCLTDDIFEENLQRAISTTHYLSTTIDTFKNFYVPEKEMHVFDLKTAIQDTLFIVEPHFKNTNISIDFIAKEKAYLCATYKNEFQQIIANLLFNAKEALMEYVKKEPMKIKIILEETENNYTIKVEDNGPGININMREMLFKPFKSTKGAKGTGNGLYLSQLIATQKLKGHLCVLSYHNPTIFLLSLSKNKEDLSC